MAAIQAVAACVAGHVMGDEDTVPFFVFLDLVTGLFNNACGFMTKN